MNYFQRRQTIKNSVLLSMSTDIESPPGVAASLRPVPTAYIEKMEEIKSPCTILMSLDFFSFFLFSIFVQAFMKDCGIDQLYTVVFITVLASILSFLLARYFRTSFTIYLNAFNQPIFLFQSVGMRGFITFVYTIK